MSARYRTTTGGHSSHDMHPMLVFMLVLAGGAILLGGIEHLHHLIAGVGNVCFVALPLLAAFAAAATRLHQN